MLGLNLLKEEKATNIPQEIIDLAQQRKQAKAQKEYAKADELRKQMEEKGYKIEDVKDGYKLRII